MKINIEKIKEWSIEAGKIYLMIILAVILFVPVAIIFYTYMIIDYSILCIKSRELVPMGIYWHILNNKFVLWKRWI